MSDITFPNSQTHQVPWYKLLKFAPLVIILMYMRSQKKPVTQIGIAEAFDINRKTAAAYLRQLTKYGMIAHLDHNNGYMLVEGGQQMLLELDAGWVENGHLPLKESFKELKDLKIKDKKEGKKQMSTFWTCPSELTTERILSETVQLFGFETISFGVSDRDPSLAMALVAHAYDQRLKLAKPHIFVYRRLQRNETPDKKYLIDPLAYLPNSFLHALGLAELEVVDIEIGEVAEKNQTDAEWLMDELANQDSGFSATCISCKPVSLDAKFLTLEVKTKEKKEFYENRFKERLDNILLKIWNKGVQVRFVAVETEGVK